MYYICLRLYVLWNPFNYLPFFSQGDTYNSKKNACDSACISLQHLCLFYGVSPSFLVELGITITTQEWPFAPCLSSPRWLNKLCFFLSFTHTWTHTHTHTLQLTFVVHISTHCSLDSCSIPMPRLCPDTSSGACRFPYDPVITYPCDRIILFVHTDPWAVIPYHAIDHSLSVTGIQIICWFWENWFLQCFCGLDSVNSRCVTVCV